MKPDEFDGDSGRLRPCGVLSVFRGFSWAFFFGLCLFAVGCAETSEHPVNQDVVGEFYDLICWDTQGSPILSANRHSMTINVERNGIGLRPSEYWILHVRSSEPGMCRGVPHDLDIWDPNSGARGVLTVAPCGEVFLSFRNSKATFSLDQVICDFEVLCPGEPRRLSDVVSFQRSPEAVETESKAFRCEVVEKLKKLSKRLPDDGRTTAVSSLIDFGAWLEDEFRSRRPFLDSETRFRTVRMLRSYFNSQSISEGEIPRLCSDDQKVLLDARERDGDSCVNMETLIADAFNGKCS